MNKFLVTGLCAAFSFGCTGNIENIDDDGSEPTLDPSKTKAKKSGNNDTDISNNSDNPTDDATEKRQESIKMRNASCQAELSYVD